MPLRPLPVIGGVVRCSVQGQTPSSQPWVNVLHMEYALGASAPGTVEINALDTLLARLYTGTPFSGADNILHNCRPGTTISQINYTPLDGSSISLVKPHTGTGASAYALSTPSEVSAVLTLRTDHRGRRYRGRIFLPPFAADCFDASGNLISGIAAGMIADWTGLTAALVAVQWRPVVASYGYSLLKDGTVSTWTPFATPVTSATMDLKADVQRRRK